MFAFRSIMLQLIHQSPCSSNWSACVCWLASLPCALHVNQSFQHCMYFCLCYVILIWSMHHLLFVYLFVFLDHGWHKLYRLFPNHNFYIAYRNDVPVWFAQSGMIGTFHVKACLVDLSTVVYYKNMEALWNLLCANSQYKMFYVS